MSIAQQLITAEQFAEMEFDRPTELVRGEIVECEMPYSKHGLVCAAIVFLLYSWNRKHNLGLVISHDSWIQTERDPDSVRGPDVFYVRRDKVPEAAVLDKILDFPVDLVVEVLSPSNRPKPVRDKVEEYIASGTTEVWVVDPDKRTVDTHQANRSPEHFTAADTLTRPELLPGFSCPVAEFFADI
jgi:Uma2 family endonuclease